MQDPFFAVKEEVEHSLTVVRQLHSKWSSLRSSGSRTDEFEWTSSELLSGLRSIDWDLQDLEDTVSIVEGSRQKFQLDDAEVQGRKDFIERTRQQISSMRDEVQGTANSNPAGGYSTHMHKSSVLPGVGAKGKGYGTVKQDDVLVDKAVQPMSSAVGDEILGIEAGLDGSPPSRHRGKKLCLILFLLLGVAGAVSGSISLAGNTPPSSTVVADAVEEVSTAPPAAPPTFEEAANTSAVADSPSSPPAAARVRRLAMLQLLQKRAEARSSSTPDYLGHDSE
uniref:Syntaxin 6/10/61 N-terminal domain-containing protein n=1 Tax=Coccolithus braarudii TaxID=221442 RepID=A0A7S0L6Q1_9EUKA|mmetsp:Transcript_18020/g.38709  ORF Transcript_18020/g.38709 Transcript_18020/m.38709 type:complete len:280 (+) Transcript_18020:104-943(+)